MRYTISLYNFKSKSMKKLLFAVLLLSTIGAFSQSEKAFGIKAGLNYNSNGELKDVSGASDDILHNRGDSKVGYHVGVFGKLGFSNLYLRPELVYTKTKSDYDGSDFDMSKLDLPVLLGYKIIGPLSVFAGPSFQYILNTDLEDVELGDVKNDFSVGLNIGAGLQIGRLGFDIRYERGFSKNEADIIINNTGTTGETLVVGRVDSRPSQVIFSLSVEL
jgi:hypothetical protein